MCQNNSLKLKNFFNRYILWGLNIVPFGLSKNGTSAVSELHEWQKMELEEITVPMLLGSEVSGCLQCVEKGPASACLYKQEKRVAKPNL